MITWSSGSSSPLRTVFIESVAEKVKTTFSDEGALKNLASFSLASKTFFDAFIEKSIYYLEIHDKNECIQNERNDLLEEGDKDDDEYNAIRSKYGDTTNKDAQLAALRSLGLTAKFITNGNAALLENEIRNNRPVAVGWLHKGPVSYPTGGGHWSCCIGFAPDCFIFNDPNGEADMNNGGYVSNESKRGTGVKYSRKNWLRRWECDGNNTGWAILINE